MNRHVKICRLLLCGVAVLCMCSYSSAQPGRRGGPAPARIGEGARPAPVRIGEGAGPAPVRIGEGARPAPIRIGEGAGPRISAPSAPRISPPPTAGPTFNPPVSRPPAGNIPILRPSGPETRPAPIIMGPGITRPDRPDILRPEGPGITRPDRPDIRRPENPGITRPDRPDILRPEGPGITRPDRPDIRRPEGPGITRPDIARPGDPGRHGPGDKGFIPPGGRPGWQNLPPDRIHDIYGGLDHAWHRDHLPPPPPPAPRPYWENWGLSVRFGWCDFMISSGCFSYNWWDSMPYHCPWWNYYCWRDRYPSTYWWNCPTWASVCSYYPTWNWDQGYYYDYSTGGNVVIRNNYVYVNDQQVATQQEYAQSAAELASTEMPTEETEQVKNAIDWLPLGTFALSASAQQPQETSKAAIQLAATKEGLISGSFYNREMNRTFPIQGRVDKNTQRVAFTVIGAEDTVFETGMYNLTQKEAPLLIHTNGGTQTKNCVLVRLDAPKTEDSTNAADSDAEMSVHSILD